MNTSSFSALFEMDDQSLLHLLSGGHFNMIERAERGIWPHPPIPIARCVEVIQNVLLFQADFPRPYTHPTPGQIVGDIISIQKLQDTDFILHAHAASPYDIHVITAESHTHYADSASVARDYLKFALCLPGDLDGWKVTE